MKETYSETLAYLGIAGSCAYGAGVENGQRFSMGFTTASLTPYFGELREGGIVIDARPVGASIRMREAVSGPMVDVTLPSKSARGFGGTRTVLSMDSAGEDFDYVSMDIYADHWEKLGAKVGIRRGGKIHWNQGGQTRIHRFEERFSWAALETGKGA
jgi:hypothetical protein